MAFVLTFRLRWSLQDCGDLFRCPDANVIVVFSGTPEFWQDQSDRLSGQTRFAVALTNTELDPDKMQVISGQGLAPIDPETEVTAEVGPAAGEDGFKTNKPISAGSTTAQELTEEEASQGEGPQDTTKTVVTGRINNWREHWAPIVVQFAATDWISNRSFGTCYIRLPLLTGTGNNQTLPAIDEAQLELEKGNRQGQEVERRGPMSYGITRLRTSAGLSANDSSPPPSSYASRVAVWSCESSSATLNEIVRSPLAKDSSVPVPGAAPASLYSGVNRHCGSIAVVSHPFAEPVQQVTLILFGVAISIAVDTLRKGRPGPDRR